MGKISKRSKLWEKRETNEEYVTKTRYTSNTHHPPTLGISQIFCHITNNDDNSPATSSNLTRKCRCDLKYN